MASNKKPINEHNPSIYNDEEYNDNDYDITPQGVSNENIYIRDIFTIISNNLNTRCYILLSLKGKNIIEEMLVNKELDGEHFQIFSFQDNNEELWYLTTYKHILTNYKPKELHKILVMIIELLPSARKINQSEVLNLLECQDLTISMNLGWFILKNIESPDNLSELLAKINTQEGFRIAGEDNNHCFIHYKSLYDLIKAKGFDVQINDLLVISNDQALIKNIYYPAEAKLPDASSLMESNSIKEIINFVDIELRNMGAKDIFFSSASHHYHYYYQLTYNPQFSHPDNLLVVIAFNKNNKNITAFLNKLKKIGLKEKEYVSQVISAEYVKAKEYVPLVTHDEKYCFIDLNALFILSNKLASSTLFLRDLMQQKGVSSTKFSDLKYLLDFKIDKNSYLNFFSHNNFYKSKFLLAKSPLPLLQILKMKYDISASDISFDKEKGCYSIDAHETFAQDLASLIEDKSIRKEMNMTEELFFVIRHDKVLKRSFLFVESELLNFILNWLAKLYYAKHYYPQMGESYSSVGEQFSIELFLYQSNFLKLVATAIQDYSIIDIKLLGDKIEFLFAYEYAAKDFIANNKLEKDKLKSYANHLYSLTLSTSMALKTMKCILTNVFPNKSNVIREHLCAEIYYDLESFLEKLSLSIKLQLYKKPVEEFLKSNGVNYIKVDYRYAKVYLECNVEKVPDIGIFTEAIKNKKDTDLIAELTISNHYFLRVILDIIDFDQMLEKHLNQVYIPLCPNRKDNLFYKNLVHTLRLTRTLKLREENNIKYICDQQYHINCSQIQLNNDYSEFSITCDKEQLTLILNLAQKKGLNAICQVYEDKINDRYVIAIKGHLKGLFSLLLKKNEDIFDSTVIKNFLLSIDAKGLMFPFTRSNNYPNELTGLDKIRITESLKKATLQEFFNNHESDIIAINQMIDEYSNLEKNIILLEKEFSLTFSLNYINSNNINIYIANTKQGENFIAAFCDLISSSVEVIHLVNGGIMSFNYINRYFKKLLQIFTRPKFFKHNVIKTSFAHYTQIEINSNILTEVLSSLTGENLHQGYIPLIDVISNNSFINNYSIKDFSQSLLLLYPNILLKIEDDFTINMDFSNMSERNKNNILKDLELQKVKFEIIDSEYQFYLDQNILNSLKLIFPIYTRKYCTKKEIASNINNKISNISYSYNFNLDNLNLDNKPIKLYLTSDDYSFNNRSRDFANKRANYPELKYKKTFSKLYKHLYSSSFRYTESYKTPNQNLLSINNRNHTTQEPINPFIPYKKNKGKYQSMPENENIGNEPKEINNRGRIIASIMLRKEFIDMFSIYYSDPSFKALTDEEKISFVYIKMNKKIPYIPPIL